MADKDRKTVPFSPKKKATTQPTAGERPTVPFRGSRDGKPSRVGEFDESEAGKTSAHPRATVPLGVSADGGEFSRMLGHLMLRGSKNHKPPDLVG